MFSIMEHRSVQRPLLNIRRRFQSKLQQQRAQSKSTKPSTQANPSPEPPSTSTSPLNKLARLFPTTNLSIPLPTNLWVQVQASPLAVPFRAYNNIQRRRPYATQITASIIIYFLGDLSSQTIQNRGEAKRAAAAGVNTETGKGVAKYDPIRAARAVLIGAISSIPSYHFFLWLSRSFNIANRPYTSLGIKLAVNQFSFAPLFNTYFFGMQSLLSSLTDHLSGKKTISAGEAFTAAWVRVRDTVPISWLNSCRFWPFVTAFSFTFIPVQHRGVFAGVVAIGWQSYLGVLNQRAANAERAKSAGGHEMRQLAQG